jgi:hypothetical protein
VRALLVVPALAAGLGAAVATAASTPSTTTSATDTSTVPPSTIGFCPPPSPGGAPTAPTTPTAPCRKPPTLSSGTRRAALLVGGAVQSTQTSPKGRPQVRFTLDHLYGRARKLLHGLGRETAVADIPGGAQLIGPDGSAVDPTRLVDATAIHVRGRVLEPAKWVVGDEGTALPTIRATRVQLVGLASSGVDDGSGDTTSCDVLGTCVPDPCADGSCALPPELPIDVLPTEAAPAPPLARFIGEVTARDTAAGTVTLHVVTVENLPGDQSEDDFDGDKVTFKFGSDAVFQVKPDRSGDGSPNLADIQPDDLAKIDVPATDKLPTGVTLTAVFIDSRAP